MQGARQQALATQADLIHGEHLALVHLGDAFVRQVENAARSGNHHVHDVVQPEDIVPETRAPGCHHDLNAKVLAKFLANL